MDYKLMFSQPVYIACIMLHVLELFVRPPTRFPDIFPVLNVLISTPVFVMIWLWSIKCGIEISWSLVGLSGSSHKPKPAQSPVEEEFRKGSRSSGIAREQGARATSLGFSHGRRRGTLRPASVADVRR